MHVRALQVVAPQVEAARTGQPLLWSEQLALEQRGEHKRLERGAGQSGEASGAVLEQDSTGRVQDDGVDSRGGGRRGRRTANGRQRQRREEPIAAPHGAQALAGTPPGAEMANRSKYFRGTRAGRPSGVMKTCLVSPVTRS